MEHQGKVLTFGGCERFKFDKDREYQGLFAQVDFAPLSLPWSFTTVNNAHMCYSTCLLLHSKRYLLVISPGVDVPLKPEYNRRTRLQQVLPRSNLSFIAVSVGLLYRSHGRRKTSAAELLLPTTRNASGPQNTMGKVGR